MTQIVKITTIWLTQSTDFNSLNLTNLTIYVMQINYCYCYYYYLLLTILYEVHQLHLQ